VLLLHFRTAKEAYGVLPTTVWNVNYGDRKQLQLRRAVGDAGQTRQNCLRKPTKVYEMHASVFRADVASWILNLYAPRNGMCFDPFSGGGTRAILAAAHGLAYLGVELRAAQARATRKRCERLGASDFVHVVTGDSRDCSQIVATAEADFVFTCPPYWNLERYHGGPADLSMQPTYKGYLREMRKVVAETYRALKPGSYSCWVVGQIRGRGPRLLPLNHDIAALHVQEGFVLKEEIMLAKRSTPAVRRIGGFEKGRRLLIRTHEYVLVFWRPK